MEWDPSKVSLVLSLSLSLSRTHSLTLSLPPSFPRLLVDPPLRPPQASPPTHPIHGPGCNCDPESALKVQLLRLIHCFCDRDSCGRCLKPLLFSVEECRLAGSFVASFSLLSFVAAALLFFLPNFSNPPPDPLFLLFCAVPVLEEVALHSQGPRGLLSLLIQGFTEQPKDTTYRSFFLVFFVLFASLRSSCVLLLVGICVCHRRTA